MGTGMVSLRLEDELLEWATVYAKARGVSRTELLAEAIASFKEDAESGVPNIRAQVRRMREAAKPRPGECSCPVDGFRGSCPVHGARTREDFQRAVADRSALFRTLQAPASTRGVKPKESK